MGQTLSEPIVEKHTKVGGNEKFKYATGDMQGWRISMEDALSISLEMEAGEKTAFFAVFDGHGGSNVAQFVGENCPTRVSSDPEFKKGNYPLALKNGFLGLDEDIRAHPRMQMETSGCTAVALLITKNDRLYCANAGDSRCVLSSAGVAVPLSFDHKPYNEIEVKRITEAGGFVHFGRVNGNLALSRAIGDLEFKRNSSLPPERQIVTADPDVIDKQITPEDEFIVLACDGIWDVMSNQQVVDFVRARIAQGDDLKTVCEKMLDRCLAKDPSNGVGCDNMTIIIISLNMGISDEDWRKKCQKVAIVDGMEVNPMETLSDSTDLALIQEQEEVLIGEEDPEQKYHF